MVAKYLWRDEYAIGNEEIDSQHRRLFELLDELYQAVCQGNASQSVMPVLEELVAYTREHFYAEESLMREVNYPGLAQHQQEHEALLAAVQRKIAALERGDKVLSIELLEFVHQWLSGHILNSDRAVASFCRGR
ncbi:bacteriohemerythrin [Motiliproteus sp. SC1-56]|uniref:bacteriohemerythrin n=1 Tax=Motiliproteus sp. SC1-56 TaxID=2799565 RepID=UPI001A8BF503|nr:bacteriohemerythrin [Motiliproteus sp. SC1-56]